MAAQAKIISLEIQVIDFQDTIKEINECLEIEVKNNDGAVYNINRDCWGTLMLNAVQTQSKLEKIIRKLKSVL